MQDIFQEMATNWPSAIVARSEVGKFSGGLLHPATMRNRDSLGDGPPFYRIGRRVVYPTDQLANWLRSRAVQGGQQQEQGEK